MSEILSRASRRRKRMIENKATKAMADLEFALRLMRDFATDHEPVYRHLEAEDFKIQQIRSDLSDIVLYPSALNSKPVRELIHSFILLRED